MSKEVAHQCIDENIVSNGKKGITAESLANTLHLMVDEGGGGVGDVFMVEFSLQEDNTGITTSAQKAHNKEIFDKIKAMVKEGKPCPMVGFDYLKLMAASEPEISLYFDSASLVMYPMLSGYMSGTLLASEIGYNEIVITVALLASLVIMILPDGSVLLDS